MKKIVIAIVFAGFFFAVSPIFAQETQNGNQSNIYYVNISIERIWPHKLGYVVQYRRDSFNTARVYLPLAWFSQAAGKGEILSLPRGEAWPSMTVFYQNGEFSHVRLYVHPWESHQSWGVFPQGTNFDQEFEGVEAVNLQF